MTLTEEQIKELKAQLAEQIAHLPEEQKAKAQKQIDELSTEALESMIQQQQSKSKEESIFRKIINKEIPSVSVDENKSVIAVMDIAPISEGHTIIIPKKAITSTKSLPNLALSLAKKISKRLVSKLKAKSSEIATEFKFGELIINVIPIYDKSLSLNSPRKKATVEELEAIAVKLRPRKRAAKSKVKITKIPSQELTENSVLKWHRKVP